MRFFQSLRNGEILGQNFNALVILGPKLDNKFEIYDASVTVQQPFLLRFPDDIISQNFQFHRGDVVEISNAFRDSIRSITVKEIDQINSGNSVFGYEALIDWGKDNGVIEWDRVYIPDGWNHLTDEEKRYLLLSDEEDDID